MSERFKEVNRKMGSINYTLQRMSMPLSYRRVTNSTISRVSDNNAESVVVADTNNTCSLSKHPRTLHELWKEYEHGTGDRKAAKLFTSQEKGKAKTGK